MGEIRERGTDLDMLRAGGAGGKLKPLLRAWARKDFGAVTELSRHDVCLHSVCAEREVTFLHAAFKPQQGLHCSLVLFCGWILSGEFKAEPSWVSRLVL